MPFTISKKFLPNTIPPFKVIQAKAAEKGVNITGSETEGKVEGFGVIGSYVIAPGEVTISIEKTPFLVPEKMVKDKIQEWLDSFKG
jgi:hypothetical protein